MASVPLSGSNIKLLQDIPFSNDYKHTRYFDNKTLQTNYFWSKPFVHTMTRANFQRIEGRTFIKVDKDIDSLHGVNYLMFQNTAYNDKWFYAFVTKLEYIQKNTTYVHFEIDVFQTWWWEANFKPSYVIREHCKLWNSDGTPVINTIDEGLDYGLEYDTVNYYWHKPRGDYKWLVIISKSLLHNDIVSSAGEIYPTVIGTVQPLSYYLVPYKDDSFEGVSVKDTTGDTTKLSSAINVLKELYLSESAVNNIVSIYTTEHIGLDITVTNDVISFPTTGNVILVGDVAGASSPTKFLNIGYIDKFSTSTFTLTANKYQNFRTVKESKLLMYPYSMNVLEDFKGNRVNIKTEYINKPGIDLIVRGSLGTSNKVSYSISQYNQSNISENYDKLLSIENGLLNVNPNDVSVLTDYLSSFLQGNRNTLINQKNTAIFDGVMNVASSGVSGVESTLYGNIAGSVKGGLNMVKGAGNSVLKIQGIQAKVKDANNIPPQLSKMGSNTVFDYGNRYNGVFLLQKQLKPEYQKKLEDFFNMYGYKVNTVKIPNFHTRVRWNYVQTESCNITGNFNNEDLQELKSIFDNGITLWHINDVGNYSYDNGVI